MSVGSIEIKCMSDKPVNGLAKCRRIVTKVLIGDSYVNVYDSYRAMASSHEVKKYRQVYTGMSPDERQCITCDVDIPFREDVVEEIKHKCYLYRLPLPTNIVVNLREVTERPPNDQHHYQLQWELDAPFYAENWAQTDRYKCRAKNAYLSIIEKLAYIFNGDKNYKGLWHKNAYCTNEIRRIAVTDSTSKLSDFLDWYEANAAVVQTKSRSQKATKSNTPKDPSLSRNCYMLSRLPSKIFHHMYRTGQLPDIDLAMEWARDLERKSLRINGKDSIEPDYLIKATVNGVLNRCEKSYDAASMERSNIRRELSLAIRRVKQSFKVLKAKELLKEGKAKKEVARLLSININTVRIYSSMSIDEVRDNFLEFIDFCTRNDIKGYESMCRSVTDALTSLY